MREVYTKPTFKGGVKTGCEPKIYSLEGKVSYTGRPEVFPCFVFNP